MIDKDSPRGVELLRITPENPLETTLAMNDPEEVTVEPLKDASNNVSTGKGAVESNGSGAVDTYNLIKTFPSNPPNLSNNNSSSSSSSSSTGDEASCF